MSEMISVASGFQYSVNIAYDLNSEEKLRNYIPTKAAMQLMDFAKYATGCDRPRPCADWRLW